MQKIVKHLLHKPTITLNHLEKVFVWTGVTILLIIILAVTSLIGFDSAYRNRIYPNVFVGSVWFGGKTSEAVAAYWNEKNLQFTNTNFEFRSGDVIATVSAQQLEIGYDAQMAREQAYQVGRSGNFMSDLKTKLFVKSVNITPYFRYKTDIIDQTLNTFSDSLDIPPQDALFTFQEGKVLAFKPSKKGLKVNTKQARELFVTAANSLADFPQDRKVIDVPIDIEEPRVTTDRANAFGIRQLLASGYSEFHGSIPGRIHNVALASSRFNGVLIPPGEVFSFNKLLGDVSAATGFQPAYIIKGGRTVLGDGGGVCQVSTTLFRAALNAGLPIVERHPHAYRVHYYEEAGYKVGMDATVFDPTADLKIKNNTPGYILIQTETDLDNLSLTFDLYGQSDGRRSEISNYKMWDVAPPPPTLFQDDPTMKIGEQKQVDFAAWGAKASFDYKVTRGNENLESTTFYSTYRPWQAVFLKGTLQ